MIVRRYLPYLNFFEEENMMTEEDKKRTLEQEDCLIWGEMKIISGGRDDFKFISP